MTRFSRYKNRWKHSQNLHNRNRKQKSQRRSDAFRWIKKGAGRARSREKEINKEDAAAKSGEKTTEEKTKQEASDWKEGAAEELEEGSQGDIYVVRKGDTLLSISRKVYGTDENIASICKINGLKENDFIYVGQKLLLP